MLIIWRALVTYIDENLRKGLGVNIRGFGAFTFEIETDMPKIASSVFKKDGQMPDLNDARAERKHIHHLK